MCNCLKSEKWIFLYSLICCRKVEHIILKKIIDLILFIFEK